MRRTPLYRAAWKPTMLVGCERVPFVLVAIVSGILVMEGGFWIKVIGAAFFVIGVGIMALINSKEPFAFAIGWRYLFYQDYYASHALYPGKPDRPNNF